MLRYSLSLSLSPPRRPSFLFFTIVHKYIWRATEVEDEREIGRKVALCPQTVNEKESDIQLNQHYNYVLACCGSGGGGGGELGGEGVIEVWDCLKVIGSRARSRRHAAFQR